MSTEEGLLKRLLKKGTLVCKSPRVRKELHHRLKMLEVPYATVVVGELPTVRSMAPTRRRGSGYTPERLVDWIRQGRVYAYEALAWYDTVGETHYSRAELKVLFRKDIGYMAQLHIVKKICTSPSGECIFDFIPMHTLVVRFDLV